MGGAISGESLSDYAPDEFWGRWVRSDQIKERLKEIRNAGGLTGIDDMISISLKPIIAAAGALWEKRREGWSAKIVELCARHCGPKDVQIVEGERLTIVFHPESQSSRDEIVFAIIRDLRDFFLGTVEIAPETTTAQTASGEEVPKTLVMSGSALSDGQTVILGQDSAFDDKMREERGGDEATRMWKAAFAPVWVRRVVRDRKGLDHPLIVPRITTESSQLLSTVDYYEPHPERTRIDISALRAASSQARRLAQKEEFGKSVFFSVGLATLTTSSEARGFAEQLRALDANARSILVPIIVRVPPGSTSSFIGKALSTLGSLLPRRYLGATTLSQLQDLISYSNVEGFLVEQAPLSKALDYQEAAKVCRERNKKLLVIHSEDEEQAELALKQGADFATIKL